MLVLEIVFTVRLGAVVVDDVPDVYRNPHAVVSTIILAQPQYLLV